MTEKQRARARDLCIQLPIIQHELFSLGLVVTSAHMSKTIGKLGYELCLADLHAKRFTPGHKRYLGHLQSRGDTREIEKDHARAIRSAEKMLYGSAS